MCPNGSIFAALFEVALELQSLSRLSPLLLKASPSVRLALGGQAGGRRKVIFKQLAL